MRNKIAERTRDLRTLVMMQLKNKVNLSYYRNWRVAMFRVIFTLMLFAIFTFLIFLLFDLFQTYRIVSNHQIIPVNFMIFVFTIVFFISLITNTLSLSKSLYLDHDNKLLLTFPVNSNTVFFSKMIVFYLTELRRQAFLMLPIFVAFGMINGFGAGYFFILLFGFLFLTLFIITLSAVLSIPAMYLIRFLRRFRIVQIAVVGGLLAVGTWLVFSLINAIPEDLNIIRDFPTYALWIINFLGSFEGIIYPFGYLTQFLTGTIAVRANVVHTPFPLTSLWTFLVMLGIIVVLGLFIWFVIRKLFFRMASASFENRKSAKRRVYKNRKLSPTFTTLRKEFVTIARTPSGVYGQFAFLYVMPFAILLLNRIFANLNTQATGDSLSLGVNLLIISLIVLQNNTSSASLFSREGSSYYLQKIMPSSIVKTMAARISINFVLTVVSLALSIWIIADHMTIYSDAGADITAITMVLLFFIVMALFLVHTLWSIDMDLANPQHKRYHGRAVTNNINELKSSGLAFALAFATFGFMLFLMFENNATALPSILGLLGLLLGLRIWLNWARMKVLFKEF